MGKRPIVKNKKFSFLENKKNQNIVSHNGKTFFSFLTLPNFLKFMRYITSNFDIFPSNFFIKFFEIILGVFPKYLNIFLPTIFEKKRKKWQKFFEEENRRP